MIFEMLDLDREKPRIINYYIMDMDRTYMYFRISSAESTDTYYMLSLDGTDSPTYAEIKNGTLRIEHNT